MLRLIWRAHKVQKWTGNTASQGRLRIKFRESNKSRRIGQSPGSQKQTHPQGTALMCSAPQTVMAPSLSLMCRSTGWELFATDRDQRPGENPIAD